MLCFFCFFFFHNFLVANNVCLHIFFMFYYSYKSLFFSFFLCSFFICILFFTSVITSYIRSSFSNVYYLLSFIYIIYLIYLSFFYIMFLLLHFFYSLYLSLNYLNTTFFFIFLDSLTAKQRTENPLILVQFHF